MLATTPTPLVRLSNLFPDRRLYAKCEHLAPSGCFKIRGAVHLLNRLGQEGRSPPLVVPSMGNTALGIAVGARAFGFTVTGVVPQTIGRDKDEKLQAMGVELLKSLAAASCCAAPWKLPASAAPTSTSAPRSAADGWLPDHRRGSGARAAGVPNR